MLNISGLSLPLVQYPGVRTPIYPHQAMMLSLWNERNGFILTTKTGSGKTASAVLPLIYYRQGAVFVYPTNELIKDQERSIMDLMGREGVTYRVLSPDNINEKYGRESFDLIRVDADRLRAYAEAFGIHEKNRAIALARLIKPDRPKIILINPDLLYLFYSLRYRMAAEVIAHLQAYQTVVFDEFHLYAGVELSHILFLIHTARSLRTFQRIVLLTATPARHVMDLVNRLLENPIVITGIEHVDLPIKGSRTVIHDVQLVPKLLHPDEPVSQLADELEGLKGSIEEARQRNPGDDFVPAVVIVNSVIHAIRLEDELVDRGWSRKHLGIIRGLAAQSSRDICGKLVVLGTSAIEVGIDFKTGILIFQAGDAAGFMQRFGRLGRHMPGKAILFGNAREYGAFSTMAPSLKRDEFETEVLTIYGERDTMAWFVRTQSGALSMAAQAEHIRKVVLEDRNLGEQAKKDLDLWIDKMIDDFAKIMDMEREFRSAKSQSRRMGKLPWLQAYVDIEAFRTSFPSVEVFDWAEKARGREPTYFADVRTLLHWAQGSPRCNRDTDTIHIDGYSKGKPHKVWVDGFVPDDSMVGCWFSTGEEGYKNIRLVQDGHLTSVSHIMTFRPRLFTLVPLEMTRDLDWRIQTFRVGSKGNYAIAFDGAALLLKEIWSSRKNCSFSSSPDS